MSNTIPCSNEDGYCQKAKTVTKGIYIRDSQPDDWEKLIELSREN